ncbi:hypothetical protein QBC46DRAFT_367859 [Diplogelasinospora grovesii]|uniref:Uncharacterized protein n=1 Tax=Diplogelasinospora grovesii TaxID=303347 RepID=A0AAN6MXP7_9PEZI|nr:hypothetical protein QBC46DRAFT_367859 [Diplogelasinospora grovesii]
MATRLRHLAASLIVLFQFQSAACLPQNLHGVRQVVVAAPSPWVTVDPSGAAHTITPIVTTANGATSTISPPPDALLTTGTYTMSPSGRASTSVGLAPVATATGTANPTGAFLACTMYQGLDEPFCSPKRGSLLYPGYTYYITWSPSYFASPNTTIQWQSIFSTGEGVASDSMPASTGFYAWSIRSDFLTTRNTTSLNLTMQLAYQDPETSSPNDWIPLTGPTVFITTPPAGMGASGGASPNVIAIAVPVVVGVVVLLLAGVCVWSYRKNGRVPIVGGGLKRRSTGYGERQSRSERVAAAAAAAATDKKSAVGVGGVELTDRDSWGTPQQAQQGKGQGGGNVFREELRRQEQEA